MSMLTALIRRNTKLFFKDKGMFFTSLITPVILLVLYVTFLGKVYRDTFVQMIPEGMKIEDDVLNGLVGGELVSSLLAVCCVTVAFCSNMLMVQDKVTGARRDLTITPVKPSVLAISYCLSTLISTLIITFLTVVIGFIYLANIGWCLSVLDVICIFADVVLLTLFGTLLSSIINYFLSSQGQISAVGTIVSAGYGFLCGAYMPISNFGSGLQKALSFSPSTYGTALIRNHAMRGAFAKLENLELPEELITGIKDGVDCNIYFSDELVTVGNMYWILIITVIVLLVIYVAIHHFKSE